MNSKNDHGNLWDLAPLPICELTDQGKFLDVNPCFTQLLGWTTADLEGMALTPYIHEHDQARFAENYENRNQKAVATPFEARFRSNEDKWIPLEWSLSSLRNGSRIYATLHPIQYSLNEFNTELSAETSKAPNQIEDQLRHAQRMEIVGLLAGGVAHDLNNVLAPIMMSLEILQGNEQSAEKLSLIGMLRKNCQRGSSMIRQIVTFSRGIEGEPMDVQLRHLIKEIVKVAKQIFPREITIKTKLAADLWTTHADPAQMYQLLYNLSINGRDAMPSGGTLTLGVENVELQEPRSFLHLNIPAGRYVHLTVADTGEGIPDDLKERIFEPTFSTKTHRKHAGQGLSSTLGIIAKHKGIIEVDSQPGLGTRFDIYLPNSTPKDPITEPQKKTPRRGQGERILVVDDEPVIREVCTTILIKNGYKVEQAENGAAAIALFASKADEIDLVITDIVMPVMNGVALVTALKKIRSEVKVIAASGYFKNTNLEDYSQSLKDMGVETILQKPFTAETLLNAVGEEF